MTLKAKFLLMQLLFMILVALAFYRHYDQTKHHYDLLKEATITEAKNRIQETFAHCESMIQILVEEQAGHYLALHEAAKVMLASGAENNLSSVQAALGQKLPNHTTLHLFVINADNRVEATTYQPDMGLDMNALAGAKRDIESVRLNETIILSMPSIDLMTKEYRIYSYGVLDAMKGSVLELGFFDEKISALKQQCIHVIDTDSAIESVDVFADFQNYVVRLDKMPNSSAPNKQYYLQEQSRFHDVEASRVHRVAQNKEDYLIQHEHTTQLYTYIQEEPNRWAIIAKIGIDTRPYSRVLAELRENFVYVMVFGSLFFLLFLILLEYTIIRPFRRMLYHIQEGEKIEDIRLLRSRDEVGALARIYNDFLDRQRTMEHKLKETNATLTEHQQQLALRIDEAVKQNQQQHQLIVEQSRMAQMGAMIGMIAHQWRQPLSELNFNTMYLKELLKQGQWSDILQNNEALVAFMSQTITTFEEFYKEGKCDLFAPAESIQRALLLVESSCHLLQVELKLELDETIHCHGQSNYFAQVLLAIFQNSVEAFRMRNTPTPQLRIVLQRHEARARVVICDNAGGVTIEPIEKIFELYSGEKGSSGMGLYMARLIIREKFHGEIEAYNVDDGACFWIDLPRYAMV